jgi:hypothetical protein
LEIKNITEPLLKREKEILEQINSEFTEKQKAVFENIKDKLFYGDKTTWNGYQDSIHLIKPISCDNFGPYNSCKTTHIEIILNNDRVLIYLLFNDNIRVDQFQTHYKPLTSEIFNKISELVNIEIKETLKIFQL